MFQAQRISDKRKENKKVIRKQGYLVYLFCSLLALLSGYSCLNTLLFPICLPHPIMPLEWKLQSHFAEGYWKGQAKPQWWPDAKWQPSYMYGKKWRQGNFWESIGVAQGPVIHCQDNLAMVPGGVAEGGRNTQQGFRERGLHGDPQMQIALSIGLSGSSEPVFCWVFGLAGVCPEDSPCHCPF